MRILSLSVASAFTLSVTLVPVAGAWSPASLSASVSTKYELRAAIKARKLKKRPASVELPAIAKGGLVYGDIEATTTMVMFTDIQCPFCKQFHAKTYPTLKQDYIDTGMVRFVIRHFPLSFHDQAMPAAKAVVCAREQGDEKARSLYDALIAVKTLSAKSIASSVAAVRGLDAGTLDTCKTAETTQKRIDADFAAGTAANVSGTPSFFLIGPTGTTKNVAGAMPIDAFKKAIEEVQKK